MDCIEFKVGLETWSAGDEFWVILAKSLTKECSWADKIIEH
jgi:hypothetical protein